MKIKLVVSDVQYEKVKKLLTSSGFEVDDDADFILTEKDLFVDHLIVKDLDNDTRLRLPIDKIVSIESFGHDIQINTAQSVYKTNERLYQLERLLDPELFMRISNSVIISKGKIEKIRPALSSKFTLTMTNGQIVDVTRSYYNMFRERMGI